ncbi:MAG: hypothetical protein HOL05_01200, partial [Nitrospinaceae bacterium]|nr:hypothetical protein [Nitrospinaceae bacterium]
MKLAKPKIWFVIMAALSGMGWVFLLSPWADWAPAGVRWPSVLVALIFGLSAFLSFSYYPLLAVTIIISLAFSGHSEERSKSRDHIFLNGAIFLAGFTVVFTLQSMAIIPINAHGSDGIPWGENLAAGVYVFSGIVTIIFSMKKKSSWSNGSINYPVVFKIL